MALPNLAKSNFAQLLYNFMALPFVAKNEHMYNFFILLNIVENIHT